MAATTTESSNPLALSRRTFQRFAEFITGELGIKMPEAKISMLQSRLMRRVRALGLDSLKEYQEYLFQGDGREQERAHFIDVVTTNKTDFFREPQHFDYLTRTALPALDPGPGVPWRFKLWCAGCSSGEEPYTQAMVLSEYAEQRPAFEFSIFATDISTRMLKAAQSAIYETPRIEPVSLPLRRKYLLRCRDPGQNIVRIGPALRQRIRFQRLNFMDADYKVREMFDVIFIRNVLIYFDAATQAAVITKLCRSLRPGGYLFVGHSESLGGLDVPVHSVASAVYRK